LPSNPLPEKFGDVALTNDQWKVAQPASETPRGRWWQVYGDAELDRLEGLAATNNQELALALANFDQARAAVGVARADFFPQITGSPAINRQRTSANTSPTSAAAGRSRTFTSYNVGGDATWELDLWGRVRRQVEGAQARLNASADDLEATKLSIQAEVATDYFNLRGLGEQVTLLRLTATNYARALELTRNRQKGGIATALDVAQAETQLKSALGADSPRWNCSGRNYATHWRCCADSRRQLSRWMRMM